MNQDGEMPERDGTGGVFGVSLGLSIFAIAILAIGFTQGGALESPEKTWAQHFDSVGAPTGYEFVDAVLLPNGCEALNLRRTGAAGVLTEPDEVAGQNPVQDEDDGDERIDWSSVKEGERGLAPDEVVFLFYARDASSEMLETYFQDLSGGGTDELESNGGTVIVESGELSWRDFNTNYVRQREFQLRSGEPQFVDSLRVNLSLGQSCVLVAIWPPGVPGGVEAVEALLTQVSPRQGSDS